MQMRVRRLRYMSLRRRPVITRFQRSSTHRTHNMSRSTCLVFALAPLLMLWCGVADGAPFLGLLSLLGASSTNTSLLSALALSHLQAKLTALSVISDLFSIIGNVTGDALG